MSQWPVGEKRYHQGSGAKPYEMKNVDDHAFSCTCPAWRNQGKTPPDQRTCKHLKAERGVAAEAARVAANGAGQAAAAATPPAVVLSQSGTTSGRIQTAAPNPAAQPRAAGPEDVLVTIPCLFDDPAPVAHVIRTLHAMGPGMQAVLQHRAALEQAVEAGFRKLRQDEKAKLFGPPVLLANDWWDVEDLDPTGWWLSEKLDGVRAYWDGKDFISRQGNVFPAPAWFKAGLPDHPLDGELWMARRSFQQTISVVKTQGGNGERWKAVKYVVFDVPHLTGPFEERQEALEQLCLASPSKILKICQQDRCQGQAHLEAELTRLHGGGAEGIMVRKPGSLYEPRRSSTLLKVKPFKDAEAVVIGHEPGKKQHKGKCGGLILRMPDGKTFNVGTGLKEADRQNPPRVGAVVTYKYTELTDDGIPKCASFVAVRDYE